MSTPLPPDWPHCGHGADPATDPVGCRGIHVPGHSACLAHLSDTDRAAYLAGLTPGANIDYRGTPFTEQLLNGLLDALRDPTTGDPKLGAARFDGAQFTGDARFSEAQFTDDAWFEEAQFTGVISFFRTRFLGEARFDSAQFTSSTLFTMAQFTGLARFYGAQFTDLAQFNGAQFTGDAWFNGAQFTGDAWFEEAQFTGDAWFEEARFERAPVFGPLACAGRVDLSRAMFALPVTLEIAAREVVAERTRWESTATIRLRYATVDLSHAVLSAPVAVMAAPVPFTRIYDGWDDLFGLNDPSFAPDDGEALVANAVGDALDEQALTDPAGVRITSVQGVDAAHLVLTDTDLTDCLFSGAFHLDQLRLEGRTTFAFPPIGWHHHGPWPARWTPRRTLAEEHHWRAQAGPPVSFPSSPRQWRRGPHHLDSARTPDPGDVAAVYRQLRKAFEDGKNEPGAADFYYGECEMRRHDVTGTPTGERRLLWVYWLLSGYGLRASRAFSWLLTAMTLTVLLLMSTGLPTHAPDPATTGTLHGSKISLRTTTPDPALRGGWSARFTTDRAEKAIRVAINSVVFRSSGQNLTTAGTYIEMASRLLEPTLLALGVLAIRGRIKR